MNNKLIELTQKIYKNQINIIQGCREVVKFLAWHEELIDHNDELFLIFRAIDSDTDDYPILESERRLWNQEALKKLDLEVNKYIDSVKPSVYKKCQEIIDKYGSDIEK